MEKNNQNKPMYKKIMEGIYTFGVVIVIILLAYAGISNFMKYGHPLGADYVTDKRSDNTAESFVLDDINDSYTVDQEFDYNDSQISNNSNDNLDYAEIAEDYVKLSYGKYLVSAIPSVIFMDGCEVYECAAEGGFNITVYVSKKDGTVIKTEFNE